MKILTTAEMREADRLTGERLRIPSLTLMENAGAAFARFLAARFAPLERLRIAILCGRGNNGGDGFVVARHLREMGASPRVLLFGDPAELHGDAAASYKRLTAGGANVVEIADAAAWNAQREAVLHSYVIIDALLGTGLRGPVEGLLARVISELNQHGPRTRVIAVDVPSGISSDAGAADGPAIVANHTVTFTAPKIGMMAASATPFVGRLSVADIGTPRELLEEIAQGNLRWLEPWEFRNLPLHRRADSNKGLYGHALIVAGSVGKAGAAGLAAQGALRAGAGLVTVSTPEPALATVASFAPEIMTQPLASTRAGTVARAVFDSGAFGQILSGKNALAIGPGLTTERETQEFVRAVVSSAPGVPMILDADALNAFDGRENELRGLRRMAALTPHPGEMSRLLGCSVAEVQAARAQIAKDAAARWDAFVVLKGDRTVIAAPASRSENNGAVWINSTGNPGMSSGGTGDVLTGMLAGLSAQFSPKQHAGNGVQNWPLALCLGVYLHGLAGDLAAEEFGEASLIATDVIRAIPHAFAELRDALRKF